MIEPVELVGCGRMGRCAGGALMTLVAGIRRIPWRYGRSSGPGGAIVFAALRGRDLRRRRRDPRHHRRHRRARWTVRRFERGKQRAKADLQRDHVDPVHSAGLATAVSVPFVQPELDLGTPSTRQTSSRLTVVPWATT